MGANSGVVGRGRLWGTMYKLQMVIWILRQVSHMDCLKSSFPHYVIADNKMSHIHFTGLLMGSFDPH